MIASNEYDSNNCNYPAAMPVKHSLQLAIDLAVVNMSIPTSPKNHQNNLHSQKNEHKDSDNLGILRVLISAYPKSLVVQDNEGQTHLLIALCKGEEFTKFGLINILLGKGTIYLTQS
jgi:hypothetical protein